jgi:chromosome segregation ATPase
MKLRYLLAALCACPLLAQAEIYKSVDADGHVTYSSSPIKGSKRIILEPAATTSSSSSSTSASRQRGEYSSPRDFPRIDGATQRGRDDTRRRILAEELAAEEKLLAEARQSLKEGEANPEVLKGKDGKTYRNVAKYDEKIKTLNDQVDLHQNNVEALKTELSKLK